MKFRLNVNAPNVSLFFISLMLILPFLFPHMPYPITTFYKEWLAASLGLLAFIPLIKQTAWPSYQAPTIIWLPIGMLGVMGIQLAVLDIAYWQHYFLVAQYFIFAALLMLLGSMLKQALGFEKVMQGLANALLITGLVSVIIIGLDLANIHLQGWVLTSNGGAYANIGQQNHLSTMLALAIASLTWRYASQRIATVLAWPLFILLLSGLALTASRSAWVFVAVITIAALWYRHLQNKAQSSAGISAKRLLALLALPVLFYTLQIGLTHLPTDKPVTTSNQRLVELAQKQDSPRLQVLQASWYTFNDNPMLGTGFGQLAWSNLNHANRVPGLTGTNGQAHNIVFQFLAETGAVGTTVLLVCLLAFMWRVKSALITPERALWWLMLAIIATHSMLEYPLWHLHFLAPTALLLGLGDAQSHSLSRYRPQLLITVVTMLWLGSLVQILHDYRIIEFWTYQNKSVKLTDEGFKHMVEEFQPIRRFSPFAAYADAQILAVLPLDILGLQEKLSATERILHMLTVPALAYNYVTLLALDKRMDEAKAILNKVYLRYPQMIDGYWQQTVKLTLTEYIYLFPLVKHIELLRDGPNANINEQLPDAEQFNQPAITASPTAERG